MLKTSDRYILRTFLSSYAYCLATLTLLFVLVDGMLRVDKLLADPRPFLTVVGIYYQAQVPLIFQRFGTFVTLAGAMFAVSRLVRNNEILPLLAGGQSVFRILAPVVLGSLCIGLLDAANTEYVIPEMADVIRTSGAFKKRDRVHRPGILRDDVGNTFFIGSYDSATKELRWVSFRQFDADHKLVRTTYGDYARWHGGSTRGAWRLSSGYVVEGDDVRPLAGTIDLPTSIVPMDVASLTERVSLLPLKDLRKQYRRQPYLHSLRVQFLERLGRPLTHVLLVLLGVPVLLRSRGSRGMFVGLIVVLGICATFFLAGFVCQDMGNSGHLHPFLAAWLPTIVFGVGGILHYSSMPT